jgi:murein L,D-transpeptidase YafK
MKLLVAAVLLLGWLMVAAPRKNDATHARDFPSINAAGADRTALPGAPLIDPKIVVIKSKRLLRLYSNGSILKSYRVALGLSPIENKIRAGDRRTPEGEFYICLKNSRSQFYLSLGLSYPNREHAERGLRDRLITRSEYTQIVSALDRRRVPLQNTRLGGEIFIHGNGSSSDWTWGCVALDDKDIQELFDAVPVGTPVTIEH